MRPKDEINILLVDDQPGKLMSYEVILQNIDANLIKANSATEALEQLLKNEIAVVLVDVCMPDFDGFQLAQMIREHPRFQETAIIFISAIQISDVDHVRGFAMGAVDYVPVPVVPEVLRAKVKVFCDLYRKSRELALLNRELEQRVTERTMELEATNKSLMQSEQRRSLALAAGHMGSWDWDVVTGDCVWDEGQYRICGVDPETFKPTYESVRPFLRNSDRKRLQEAFWSASKDNGSFQTEVEILLPNSEVRWCILAAAGTFDVSGTPLRVSGVMIDITDRKEAEERHSLLAREVDHRARNTLAVVQAVVRLTKAETTPEYVSIIEGRIHALAATHNLLSAARWTGAEIDDLVREVLAPYVGASKIVVEGPQVRLSPDKAQTAGLAVHELATNAAKYGALSCESGVVNVKWWNETGGMKIEWSESGGPAVTPPTSPGLGTKIITSSLQNQGSGGVVFDWRPEGLRCTLTLPSTQPPEEKKSAPELDNLVVLNSKPRRRLLLVEDETFVGMMMSDLLTDAGYSVVGPVASLAEAVAAAQSNEFEGAILDVNVNGDAIYPLATLLGSRGVPLIFVTGYDDASIDAGFRDIAVLQKPLDPNLLRIALQANFGTQRASTTKRTAQPV